MKNVILFMVVLCANLSFAQTINDNEPSTVNRVDKMAVYPGCDAYTSNKRELIMCFGKKLSQDFMKFLDTEWPNGYEYIDKDRLAVQLEFVVNKDGRLTDISFKRGDKVLEKQAVRSFENLADWLYVNNKLITPAELENGEKVNLIFSIPVVLQNTMTPKQREREKKRYRKNVY